MGHKLSDFRPDVQRRILADNAPHKIGQLAQPQMPHKIKGVMNNLERDFHVSYLHARELAGELILIRYEGLTLPIAHRCTYTPDYVCETKEGQKLAFEVKAPHRFKNAGIIKLKVAATKYKDIEFYLCEKKKGQWSVKPVPVLMDGVTATDPDEEEVE